MLIPMLIACACLTWEENTAEGLRLSESGQYQQAQARFEEAARLAGEMPESDPRRWRTSFNLASVEHQRGNYARSGERLAALVSTAAPSQLERARLLATLALHHRALGRMDQAYAAAGEAVTVLESAAPRSRDLANTLYSMAELDRARGRFDEAARLLSKAAAIAAPLSSDPLPALIQQATASLWTERGNLALAETAQTEAVRRLEALLGPVHPLTASAVSNLGQILFAAGRTDAAEPLLERALQIWETALGPAHRNVAVASNNLAQLRRSQGRLANAAVLYRKAIAIWENGLGSRHPDVARGWLNLGDLFAMQGKTRGAATLYKRAYSILDESLGAGHRETLAAAARMRNLGNGGVTSVPVRHPAARP